MESDQDLKLHFTAADINDAITILAEIVRKIN
jgi:hypothetical protein